jgi:hypothetical protein
MRLHMTATALGALLFALPGFAGSAPKSEPEGFALPAGCEAFLTVQNKSCSVMLMWQCEGAAEGKSWAANFSDYGLESISAYSPEYQWLDTVYTWDQSREQFTPPAADPIDMTELMKTGRDQYDFIMHRSLPDLSYDIHVTGSDHLTGEVETIDGQRLEKVAIQMTITAEDGTVEYQSAGMQYFSHELKQFFLGIEDVTDAEGRTEQYDDTPVDFILPGEPGFGATSPLYGCGGGAA